MPHAHREGKALPHEHGDLGVDLHNLYVAGKRHLPGIANQFRQARSRLHTSDDFDEKFRRSPSIGGTWLGPAQPALAQFREAMVGVLRDSEENMEETAHALILTAEWYAATDAAAARKFNAMKSEDQY